MSEQERAAAEKMIALFERLPQSRQQYFLGYADGVADMAAEERHTETPAGDVTKAHKEEA